MQKIQREECVRKISYFQLFSNLEKADPGTGIPSSAFSDPSYLVNQSFSNLEEISVGQNFKSFCENVSGDPHRVTPSPVQVIQ